MAKSSFQNYLSRSLGVGNEVICMIICKLILYSIYELFQSRLTKLDIDSQKDSTIILSDICNECLFIGIQNVGKLKGIEILQMQR